MDTYQLPRRIEIAVNGPDYAIRSHQRHDKANIQMSTPPVIVEVKQSAYDAHDTHVRLYEYLRFLNQLNESRQITTETRNYRQDNAVHTYPEF